MESIHKKIAYIYAASECPSFIWIPPVLPDIQQFSTSTLFQPVFSVL